MGTGTKQWKKNDNVAITTQGFFLCQIIAPDITGELEQERENMLEKWERITVAATGIGMSIYFI